ncbi:WecB/TagA/CpsF family glycosyltransferase [Nonomuraea sp. NPDC050540]|uniref:WecB/TagA/CpsF family glycosyltransferase n=1 Tax=Nonomuraea sp. NPDC050540 TaxID=3364367 RepID=UPI0037BAD328
MPVGALEVLRRVKGSESARPYERERHVCTPSTADRAGRVVVGGVAVDPLTERQVVERVAAELAAGRGGHIITPNVDICRTVAKDEALRRLVREAEVVVADGMPLVWASRLIGVALPERVTGADLIWSLSKMAARKGFSIYLLGGPPGVARQAGEELSSCHPRLNVCGYDAPPFDFDVTAQGRAGVRARVVAAGPKLVFVGLGFPKQDLLIEELRPELPGAWFVGCGSAIAFAAGTVHRAPDWMQSLGLEWLYRLTSEPGRLAKRYLVDDLPFAARLLGGCLVHYLRRRAR